MKWEFPSLGTLLLASFIVLAMCQEPDDSTKSLSPDEIAVREQKEAARKQEQAARKRDEDEKRKKWMQGCSADDPRIDPQIDGMYFEYHCSLLQRLAKEVHYNGWRCDTVHSISVMDKIIKLRCNESRYVYIFEDIAGTWIVRVER